MGHLILRIFNIFVRFELSMKCPKAQKIINNLRLSVHRQQLFLETGRKFIH